MRKLGVFILAAAVFLSNIDLNALATGIPTDAAGAENFEAEQEEVEETTPSAGADEESYIETVPDNEANFGENEPAETIAEEADAVDIVESGMCGNNVTWTLSEDGTLTISGSGDMYNYDCLEDYGDLTVAPYGIYASELKRLIIKDGVTSIGKFAFSGCSGFTGDLVIPDGVTSIGTYAFKGCSGFTGDLVIPESVTSIGIYTFAGCNGFTGNLVIPESVTSIRTGAFSGCSGFTGNLVIPESVTNIETYAFDGCSGFTGNLVIPESVTSIEEYAFHDCSGFTGDLVIPEGVTSIEHYAFDCCNGFTGELVIPESVTSIGWYAFHDCSGFTGDLVIPEGVTSIEPFAFCSCSGFTGDLIIPESVTSIGHFAFSFCSGFTGELIIPESVTSIENSTFYCCSGFTGDLVIPEGVTGIEYEAFEGCSSLSGKIFIPKSVEYIRDAFSGIPNRAIYGYAGSYAETYANSQQIPFYPYNYRGPENGKIDLSDQANCAHIYVVDGELNVPVQGAVVNGQTADIDGHVAIEISEEGEETLLVVTADGYNANMTTRMLERNASYYVSIYPESGQFEIVYAQAALDSRSYNLLSDKIYLEHTSTDLTSASGSAALAIEVKARGDVGKYELIQDGEVIKTSTDGKFSLPVSLRSGKNALSNLKAQKTVSVKATDTDGNSTISKIGLYISPEGAADIKEEEKKGSLTIGSSIKVDIPEEIPFLGGANAEFGLKDGLPFDLTVERNGEVKVAINKKASESFDKFKADYDRMSSKALNSLDAAKAFGGTPQSFGGGYLSANFYAKGYGEGCIDMQKPGYYKIKVDIIAGAKGSGGYTQYFFAGAVPIYLSVEGGIETSGKITVSLGQENARTTVDAGNGQISGKIYIRAMAGVGVQKVVNIGVSGTGECNYLWKPGKQYTKIWLSAYLELEAKCFGWEMNLWKSPEATYTIYETSDDEEQKAKNIYSDLSERIYDTTQYTLMDRSYIRQSKVQLMSSDTIPNGTVQSNVYPGASPRLVNANGTLYLFWLQDIETRSAENRSAIVYATSADGLSWTKPKQLVAESDNQTLDNGVDVFVDDSRIYLCWQDAAEVFGTGVSLNEVVTKLNISYAVIDAATGDVISCQTVTDKAGCYMQPVIYAQNGQVQIAWIENDMAGGDLWSAGNNETLVKYDAESGEVSRLSIGGTKEKIIGIDGAAGDSQMGVVYSLDADGDLTTIDDRSIYFDSRSGSGGNLQMLSDSGININPVSEDGVIYWFSDGDISYTVVGSDTAQQLYATKQYDIGSDFAVVSDSKSAHIIWNAIEYDTGKAAIYGTSKLENGQWTKPYIMEHTDSEMTGVLSGCLKNNVPFISYLNILNAEDGSKNYSVCVTDRKEITDIALNYAAYEYDDFRPGQTLPITAEITNKGNTAVDSIEVQWDGSTLGTANVGLGVGETKTITLEQYTAPADLNSFEQHTLSVISASESDSSDNDFSLNIGYTDMKVLCTQRLQDEKLWFDISVLNESCIASDAVLNIRADTENGAVIYTENIGMVESGQGVSLTVNMHKYENTYCTYFVEVVPGVSDAVEGNNVDFVYTGYGTDIEPGNLVVNPKTYLVTFDSNGGSYVEGEYVEEGMNATEPDPPTKEGYHFAGWYLNGEPYDFHTPIHSGITLAAVWIEYEKLAAPSVSVDEGAVAKNTRVSLTCAASGAQIYYTLDGTAPTKQSALFKEPIEIVSDTTIKAFAAREGFYDSDIVTFVYTIDPDLAPEIPNPPIDPEDPDNPDDPDTPGDVLPEDIPSGGIPDGLWIAGVEDAVYTGFAIKPQVRVYNGGTRLVQGRDYTVSYKNNIKANSDPDSPKAPSVVVKGKGNYSGTETAVFQILPVSLNDAGITAEDIVTAYTGKVQKKVPTVTYNNKKLSKGKDFTVTYTALGENAADAYKAAATYDIVITAKDGGNFTGSRTIKHTITNNTLISGASVKKLSGQMYTGSEIEPELTVTYKKTVLVKGTDYTVEYRNNIEIGTAEAVITGIGSYAGIKKVTFKITGKPIKSAQISGVENFEYDGTAKTPRLRVTLNGAALREGVDYEAVYRNNVNAGKATVTIKGINGYSGSVKKTFKIVPYDIANDPRKLLTGLESALSVKYSKGGGCPEPELCFNGILLEKGRDYIVSYKNNKKVADVSAPKPPVITIRGKGNFKGTLTKPFTITSKALDDAEFPVTMSAPDAGNAGKAGGYISKPVLTDFDGKRLVAGVDYEKKILYTLSDGTELSADDTLDADTRVHIKVTGKGAYTGVLEQTYRVAEKRFDKAKVSVTPKMYTGRAVTLAADDITVKVGKDILRYGIDYEIVPDSYVNNIDKGTATVTIKGRGSYGGIKQVRFRITSQKLSWFWHREVSLANLPQL